MTKQPLDFNSIYSLMAHEEFYLYAILLATHPVEHLSTSHFEYSIIFINRLETLFTAM